MRSKTSRAPAPGETRRRKSGVVLRIRGVVSLMAAVVVVEIVALSWTRSGSHQRARASHRSSEGEPVDGFEESEVS